MLPAARAFSQPAPRKYRVAVLTSVPKTYNAPYLAALRDRLAARGFADGKNLSIDTHIVASFEVTRRLVDQLEPKPDAIVALSTRLVEGAQAATRSIPIVFAWVADPVLSGIVKNYSRPGGNATGVSNRFIDLAVKRLEFLRELLPKARSVALAGPMLEPEVELAVGRLREVSQELGFELREINATVHAAVSAIRDAILNGAEAVMPLDVYSWSGRRITGEQIVTLMAEHRVPAIFAESELVDAGGLISYGTDLLEDVRRSADMLAAVLKGAKPAELPVDQASRFELAVNLKTARAIGVRVPPSILARADRVIE